MGTKVPARRTKDNLCKGRIVSGKMNEANGRNDAAEMHNEKERKIIMASIKVKCKGGVFSGISGRVGDFVFRAYQDDTMLVFYQPKKKKGAKDLSITDREWTENESIMSRFEELAQMFHLVIVPKDPK